MDRLLSTIKIQVNENLYNKNPETSELGKKIIENSIKLIHEIGVEAFTFKKLGKEIQSNESSIYRYFENKHKLLLYLTSWYWSWIEYQLVFSTFNVINPTEKIEKSIEILTQTISQDSNYGHINEVLLNQIIINEFSKSYLTKEVDSENKEGYFSVFKRLVKRLEEIILEIDSSYPYPLSLASTVIEGALYQSFLKDHFTSITDCDSSHKIKEFLIHLVNTTLKNSKNVR
ncbi:MAG: TetR/AcrR family transcriptional regulator [Flavobacteriaceae bacterium]|jgi:AcrR family transcriptional regulator